MHKTIIVILACIAGFAAAAFPAIPSHHGRPHAPRVHSIPHRPIHHRLPPPPPRHHYWHPSPGAFWAGVGIGTAVGILAPKPLPPPPPPVVAVNPIWIPPVYATRPVYDAHGRIIRYEQVVVRVGHWQY